MKKLISARTVRQAHADGIKELAVQAGQTLVTPEARTLARELGVRLSDESPLPADKRPKDRKIKVDEKLVTTIVTRVMDRLPQPQRDPERVKQVVVEVLSSYMK